MASVIMTVMFSVIVFNALLALVTLISFLRPKYTPHH